MAGEGKARGNRHGAHRERPSRQTAADRNCSEPQAGKGRGRTERGGDGDGPWPRGKQGRKRQAGEIDAGDAEAERQSDEPDRGQTRS